MEKMEILKDGTQVTIRELKADDIDKLMKFYKSLPLADRKYLKVDVTKKRVVLARIRKMEAGELARIVALHKGQIIADGVLEFSQDQWSRHQAEIRLIIARPFQQKGLGTVMIRELYFEALQKKVEVIVARMMRPQVGAQNIFRKLGFRDESLLPDHVKDIDGVSQDLIIMTCDVKNLMKELDLLFRDSDWQRCR
jgi:L-amino acid N-acyltransferase YncA